MHSAQGTLWVEIVKTRGSAPRDAGTAMRVTAHDITGTIGGGALEHGAIATARRILAQNGPEQHQTIPLGPSLGQCCGGAVTLHYTFEPRQTDPVPSPPAQTAPQSTAPRTALWIWGAGHVGRAFIDLCPAARFELTWIDSSAARFPAQVPPHVTQLPAQDMPRLAARAPDHAHHLIFTYSHEIDLALCAALLRRNTASIGLIGSDTKWARFSKRLRAAGLDPAPITCPIGDKSLGKAPHAIAHGLVRSLLAAKQYKVSA